MSRDMRATAIAAVATTLGFLFIQGLIVRPDPIQGLIIYVVLVLTFLFIRSAILGGARK